MTDETSDGHSDGLSGIDQYVPTDDIFSGSLETIDPALRPFYSTLHHIASLIPGKPHDFTIYYGEYEDFQYAFEVRGHQSTACVIEVVDPLGQRVECVLRSRIEEAKDYIQLARRYPLIRDVVPKLLGVVRSGDDWAILEKLDGLEDDMVTRKRQESPEFFHLYVANAAMLLLTSAQDGLILTDTMFRNGHNMSVDEKTARIRFVEQTLLKPKQRYGDPSKERIIGTQLSREYNGLVTREWVDYRDFQRKIVTRIISEANLVFVFALTKAIGRKIPLDSLLCSDMGVTNYKLAPDIIEAVREDDFDKFREILLRDDGGSPTYLLYLPPVDL